MLSYYFVRIEFNFKDIKVSPATTEHISWLDNATSKTRANVGTTTILYPHLAPLPHLDP